MQKSKLACFYRARIYRYDRVSCLTYQTRIKRLHDDGIDLKQQTVEIDSKQHIRRCTFYKDIDLWSIPKVVCPNVRTLGDALQQGFHVSNDGPCLGLIENNGNRKSLEWLSYSQVIDRAQRIGTYLLKELQLIPGESRVAILSTNRVEFFLVEQACYMYGFIVLSLYTNYDDKTIENVLDRTDTRVLFIDNVERIRRVENSFKKIFVMDPQSSAVGDQIQSLSSIFDQYKSKDICPRPSIPPDDTATFILTSGTTGEPKIAMLSHANILATAKGHLLRLEKANIVNPITRRQCSFLPMAHIYERFILLQCIMSGSEIVFCSSPDLLVEYLPLIKPTQISVVPRVLNKVYEKVMSEANKSFLKRILIQQALKEQPVFLTNFVFRKIRELFGGELKAMITASAPITSEVMNFFRIALNIPVMEGYGQTESGGTGASTHPVDFSYRTVGTPVPTTEIKLIDVPGTIYRSENNQGEVCIRGPTIFKGYYKDSEKTREVLDDNGWLRTGDVGEWTHQGTLRIIDRTKHIFKLSQGRYIAPERLEDVYIRCPWISQIFIDGNPTESSVVAVVVPDEEYVRKHFPGANKYKIFTDLCQDKNLKTIVHAALVQLGNEADLRSYEIISNIHLHPEQFSHSNGLLTVTLKTKRTKARAHFGSIIQSLYD